ncbi:MAG TPA: hypothetical protein PLH70_02510 [Bacteroidales bacterium]|nr:hypothetical protein [Bacteroidales bacterium]HOH22343.1 hypothetical protein [Bacteroidales bacterium]HPB57004.1 hypothetical protein [Bacteroidales bacterium]HPZ03276.1 hypothetical protein [Bacteroidales bacterium]HQB74659.1 hypothetical protein [Bacteroidales bacterium]
MKRIVILFLMLISTYIVMSQNRLDSLLVEYYSLSENSKDSNQYKASFFQVFPDNFQLFNSTYGYKEINEDSTYYSPLYSVSSEHIDRFYSTIDVVDKTDFYKKIINISQNSYWAADAVNYFQYKLQELFLNNTEDFLKILEGYSDIEIKTFWHFFFDGIIVDHPDNISMYGKVYRKVNELHYNHILTLLREQFQYDLHEYILSPWAKEIENQ